MKKLLIALAALAMFSASSEVVDASGHGHRYVQLRRQGRWANSNIQWHQNYNHIQWGGPVAMVAPPHAGFQSHYGWGVARTRMTPIYHQFARPYAPPGGGAAGQPQPIWPSSTDQFGVYYIRGPW